MKRLMFLVASLLSVVFASADDFKKSGKSASELIPQGWKNEQVVKGDLNKDGVADLVILASSEDSEIIKDEETGEVLDEMNFTSQSIAIYFGQSDGTYRLFKQYNELIPLAEGGDTYDAELSINSKAALVIKYSEWHAVGTSDAGSNTVIARYQNGDFYIIGEGQDYFSRMTGEGVKTSNNYLTNKRSRTTYNEFDEKVKTKTTWENLPKKPLKRLE